MREQTVLDRSCIAMMLAAVTILVLHPVFSYDLYWHLANGRAMAESGKIVGSELFSFTRFGTRFSNHEWLSQYLLFELFDRWGGLGLLGLKVALTLAISWLLFATSRFLGASAQLAALLCVVAVVVGLYRYMVRPELFSLLGVALLLFILYGYREGRLKARVLYLLPLILVVWDWLHGAIFGFVLLCAYVSAEGLKYWLSGRGVTLFARPVLPKERLQPLLMWCGITLVAMLVNPYGLLSYEIFVEFLKGNQLVDSVREFLPTSWEEYKPLWLLLGSSLVLVAVSWRRLDLTLLAIMIPFAALTIRYSRVAGVYGLVMVPVMSVLVVSARQTLRGLAGRVWLERITKTTLAVLLVAYIASIKFYGSSPQSLGYHLDQQYLPEGAVRFVKENNLQGQMYNSGEFGGYLSFYLYPERKIFQYNHHTVFGDTRYYVSRPLELERDWDINYAILAGPVELQSLFPEDGWAGVYWDSAAALVVRRTPQNRQLIEQYEVFYFHPMLDRGQLLEMAGDPEVLPRLLREVATYLRFKEDRKISASFSEMMNRHGAALPPEERSRLIMEAAAYNPQLTTLIATEG